MYSSPARRTVYSVSKHAELGKSVETAPDKRPGRKEALRSAYRRFERIILLFAGAFVALLAVIVYALIIPKAQQLTQDDIDAAVIYALDALPPEPSLASTVYEIIRPSVVRVRHMSLDLDEPEELGVGTGVIIEESGTILTNLHVVAGAERLVVVYYDGFESEADIVSVVPENDLAVIVPRVIIEGLVPATLASTSGLRVGDEVVAVGNPFGIGNSASAGIVSGLGRTYVTAEGEQILTNLIQFDAAANPGNSGGPLVNRRGEVIGIVTAIFNPTEQRFFVGIGFAVPIETAANAAGQSPF